MSSGWHSTVKTKKEIKAASNEAVAKRQASNGRKRSSNGASNKKKAAAAASKTKRPASKRATSSKKPSYKDDDDDDNDDDYDLDDFVVDDDEVAYESKSEEEFNVSDEDEGSVVEDIELADDDEEDGDGDDDDSVLEVLKPTQSRAERANARKHVVIGRPSKRTSEAEGSGGGTMQNPVSLDSDDEDNSSSDDDCISSFLPSGPKRASAPSNLLKRKQNIAAAAATKATGAPNAKTAKKRRSSGNGDSLAALKSIPKKRSETAPSTQLMRARCEDSDDDILTSPDRPLTKPAMKSRFKRTVTSSMRKDSFSESSDDDTNNRKASPSAPTRSNYFKGSPKEDDVVEVVEVADLNDAAMKDDDTPYQPRPKKSLAATKNRRTIMDDGSDDDNEQVVEKIWSGRAADNEDTKVSKLPSTQSSGEEVLLVDSDSEAERKMVKSKPKKPPKAIYSQEEEDLRAALKLSVDTFKNEQADTLNDEEPDVMDLVDDSDDDGDDQGDGDDYVDEEKKAASSVLKTAEQLSAQVVRTMSQWFGGDSSSDNGPIQGIIADGALSLGSVNTKNMASNGSFAEHKWISNEEMTAACPSVKLSDYQLIGVNWLSLLNGMKCKVGRKDTNVNGVLADEMGLGKTVQTIAFLAWLNKRNIRQGSQRPHLIAVPVSTLPNWMREFEKFCPEMKVVKYHGTLEDREEAKDAMYGLKKRDIRSPCPVDVVLVPVNYFQKENSSDRKFLNAIEYDYLIVDEAHSLKNARSTRYKMLDRVKSEHRLLLTGTPVQNNPGELLNMLSFIMPLFSRGGSSFNDADDKDSYTEQMLKHFVDETLEGGEDQDKAYSKLKQLFAPFVLRRKKDEVLGQLLPAKHRFTEVVELNSSARSIYDSIIQEHVNKSGTKITAAIGDHLFTNLRKAAHHPLMLRSRHTSAEEKEHLAKTFIRYEAFQGEGCTMERVAEELKGFSDFHIHLTARELLDANKHRADDLNRYILHEEDLFSSAKFEKLRTMLPPLIQEGHRVLIFSSWTSCLDLLGCLMDHLDLKFLRMDGSIQSAERQRLIDQFNDDPSHSVFLLSTKACGVGLNLTGADTCIIHDLDFNPFNDLQAEDRCHRIGQKKEVTVYKLVAKDTVDEDIFNMQEKKAMMNAAIMGSSNSASDKKAKKDITEAALKRFMKSANKENDEEVEILLD